MKNIKSYKMNTERFLTGNIDVDRLILMELADYELLSICRPVKIEDTYSKYAQKLCNEDFFSNRTLKRFPWTVEYKGDITWKKYYASLVFYLSQLGDEKVMKQFRHKFTFDAVKYRGNPKSQYRFFKEYANNSLNSLLADAAKAGELGIVKYLKEHGANIHSFDDYALGLASYNGHLSVVKYLVEQGAYIHAGDDDALRLASANDHLSVVQYLVEHGANIHARDDLALRWASEYGNTSVADYLRTLP